MIETRGVCHFTIAVTDSRRSTDFYTEVLGLKLLRANHERGMVFLDCGGDCLVLMKTDTTIAPVRQRDAHHAFMVDADKYEGAVQELKDRGIEIILEEERKEGSIVNGRSTYFPDPDGNVLEIVDVYAYAGAQS